MSHGPHVVTHWKSGKSERCGGPGACALCDQGEPAGRWLEVEAQLGTFPEEPELTMHTNQQQKGPWHLVSRSTGRHAGPFSTELDCVFARSIATEEWRNAQQLDNAAFTAHLEAKPADPQVGYRVPALGEGQRGTRWRDRIGFEYEWDGELSLREGTQWWHIYSPEGELLDDLIEAELVSRGATDGPYEPVVHADAREPVVTYYDANWRPIDAQPDKA